MGVHGGLPWPALAWAPFGLIGLLSWGVWLYRRTASRLYRPCVGDFRTTTSVVAAVYREDPHVFAEAVRSWLMADPGEIVVVLDGDSDSSLAGLTGGERAKITICRLGAHLGKRAALATGIRIAAGEIVILTDSDTRWEPGLLSEVQAPFADPRVGGVGTRQLVATRTSSLPRRAAAWLLNTRYLDYVPAMGRRGGVACLSGRTAAYRRSIVLARLDEFENEYFFGRRCIPGDDGRLTWLVLAAGFRTVHQSTAVAVSEFPDRWLPFFQQRLRWARNSYRCYLTAAVKGWLWRQPLVTQVTVLQVLLTPVTMGSSLFFLSAVSRRSAPLVALAYGAWIVVGRIIRAVSHLREHPDDLLIAPLMVVIIMTLAAPVKLIAFCTMNRQGWLTRDESAGLGEDLPDAVSV